MTEQELREKRVERWRLRPDLAPNNEKEVRSFIKDVGFCRTYHTPKTTIPSLIQTITGVDNSYPHFNHTHDDPYNEMLKETFRRYAQQKLFVEVGVFGKHPVIVYRDVFMRLYRIIGRDIKGGYLTRRQRNTKLETSIISLLTATGPLSRRTIRLSLHGNERSRSNAISAALESLYRQMKLIRVRYVGDDPLEWATPEQWNPCLCQKSTHLSRDEAIEYLILRFLHTAVASSRKTIHRFFKHVIPEEIIDHSVNSLVQRGLILIDPELILDGKKALKARTRPTP